MIDYEKTITVDIPNTYISLVEPTRVYIETAYTRKEDIYYSVSSLLSLIDTDIEAKNSLRFFFDILTSKKYINEELFFGILKHLEYKYTEQIRAAVYKYYDRQLYDKSSWRTFFNG